MSNRMQKYSAPREDLIFFLEFFFFFSIFNAGENKT